MRVANTRRCHWQSLARCSGWLQLGSGACRIRIEILTVSLSYPVVRDGRGRCEELLTQPELRHVTEIVTNPLLRSRGLDAWYDVCAD